MMEQIIESLNKHSKLDAWSVRHITAHSVQQYDLQSSIEAQRTVDNERFIVNVLRQTTSPGGKPVSGMGNVTILPGDDIEGALDNAVLIAGLVHNQPHSIPSPAELPNVQLVDEEFHEDSSTTLSALVSRLKGAAAEHPNIRLTAVEAFGEEETIHLVNSRGIDATQIATKFDLEWVVMSGENEREVESYVEISRRRLSDLNLETELARRAKYAADLVVATPPPAYRGPVVIRDSALATFLSAGVLPVLSSGELKYSEVTPWEIGKSIFRSEVKGDPLNLWANRRLPYGTNSNSFDEEGIPAQRIELISENKLVTFTASQRYADYLSLSPTGAFGDMEVSSGATAAKALLEEPHLEIVAFSWFSPDPITGEFASEIRLGYVVDGGERKPFKGGMLVGNQLDALANVFWSAETGFYGHYLGPTTARFAELVVTGEEQT